MLEKFRLLCIVVVLNLLLAWGSSWAQTPKVYILDYAAIDKYSIDYSIDIPGLKHNVDELPLQIAYIEGTGWKAVLGTGFNDLKWFSQFKTPKIIRYTPLVDLLKAINVKPADVQIVILPSLGYEDSGGLDLFLSADIYLHRDDFGDRTRADVREEDIRALLRAAQQGRVRLWEGPKVEIKSGLELHETPPGSLARSLVTVKAMNSAILLGGQVLHSDIWMKFLPELFPRIQESIDQLKSEKKIDEKFVLPGHDLNLKRFPEVKKGIYRVQ